VLSVGWGFGLGLESAFTVTSMVAVRVSAWGSGLSLLESGDD